MLCHGEISHADIANTRFIEIFLPLEMIADEADVYACGIGHVFDGCRCNPPFSAKRRVAAAMSLSCVELVSCDIGHTLNHLFDIFK